MRLSSSTSMAAAAVLLAASAARATPVLTVPFADGNFLNVNAVIGTGLNSAYLAVDFSNGTSEAFQYNYNGTLGGYDLLTDVEAATTLRDADTYYASFAEHFVTSVTDGSNTSVKYPPLYDSVLPGSASAAGTSSQGVTFEQSSTGIDNINLTDGQIVAFGTSYSAVPVLPEASVPEPVALALVTVGVPCALLRRRRRPARA